MMLDSVPSLLDSSAKSLECLRATQATVPSDMGSERECQSSSSPSPVSMSAPDDLFLTEAFHKADTDGDGKLSHQELKDLIQSLGLGEDKEKLNKFVLEVDADNDGSIDLDEFQVIVDKVSSKSTMTFEQQLRETFDLYDVDGSGGLDQEEIKQLMATLGHDLTDEEVSDMIAEVDEDGNGDIDYDEFVSMFKGMV
jgi:calmodulin